MITKLSPFTGKSAVLLTATLLLSSCGPISRLSNIGDQPQLSAIDNPALNPEYRPVNMPMPSPKTAEAKPNSLWRDGAQAFFEDSRANNVGDLVTVIIQINDKATISNKSTRTRANSDSAGVDVFLGDGPQKLAGLLPDPLDVVSNEIVNQATNQNLLGTSSDMSNEGNGAITRSDVINLRVAALVTQLMPNGNLVISGTQEMKVNYEKRILRVHGIVRREDITTGNTINYDQIAEARIDYGGEGQITDVQQPRWGSQIMDAILPF